MKVVCVDDESLILRGMVRHCEQVEGIESVVGFTKSQEALDHVRENPVDLVFTDINMPVMDGMELGREMKALRPQINIIYTTGYSEYALDAYKMHALGYLLKPVQKEDIEREIQNLQAISAKKNDCLDIHTFGNFEASLNGKALEFANPKTKELLAYLVDRMGAVCTNNEIISTIWNDNEDHIMELKAMRRELLEKMEELELENVVIGRWGGLGINKEKVSCDLYDFKNGKPSLTGGFNGEYMEQYGWAKESASRPR